ncbi:hypothetical protein K438DRAFT_1945114 [Mycena galopus ATCC 62051]|nr:hypothetical protein K438DRAFT_1945114 [Mycena galopus ATCC 62051]
MEQPGGISLRVLQCGKLSAPPAFPLCKAARSIRGWDMGPVGFEFLDLGGLSPSPYSAEMLRAMRKLAAAAALQRAKAVGLCLPAQLRRTRISFPRPSPSISLRRIFPSLATAPLLAFPAPVVHTANLLADRIREAGLEKDTFLLDPTEDVERTFARVPTKLQGCRTRRGQGLKKGYYQVPNDPDEVHARSGGRPTGHFQTTLDVQCRERIVEEICTLQETKEDLGMHEAANWCEARAPQLIKSLVLDGTDYCDVLPRARHTSGAPYLCENYILLAPYGLLPYKMPTVTSSRRETAAGSVGGTQDWVAARRNDGPWHVLIKLAQRARLCGEEDAVSRAAQPFHTRTTCANHPCRARNDTVKIWVKSPICGNRCGGVHYLRDDEKKRCPSVTLLSRRQRGPRRPKMHDPCGRCKKTKSAHDTWHDLQLVPEQTARFGAEGKGKGNGKWQSLCRVGIIFWCANVRFAVHTTFRFDCLEGMLTSR